MEAAPGVGGFVEPRTRILQSANFILQFDIMFNHKRTKISKQLKKFSF